MKFFEALVFLFKGLLFLEGPVGHDYPVNSGTCRQ